MARSPFHPKDEPSWLAEVLAQETYIVWLHDPSRFAYVGQAAIVTRTPGGPPSDYLGGTRFIVSYGEARERVRGLCRRRIFTYETPIAISTRSARTVTARRPRRSTP